MSQSLTRQLQMESMAMADYAFDSGLRVPSDLAKLLQAITDDIHYHDIAHQDLAVLDETRHIGALTAIHGELADLIAPATPRTILLLSQQSQSRLRFGGGVPLVHRLSKVSIISLVFLLLLSLFPEIDGHQDSFSLTSQVAPRTLMVNFLFLLSAASLGACFSALFLVNGYIKQGTFDSAYESTYWARFVLGLMAGIIMAMIIPLDVIAHSEHVTPEGTPSGMGPPLLALLGGFAASFVYRVLNKLVKMMEVSVKSDPKDALAVQEQQAQMRLEGKAIRDRMEQARQLAYLQQKLSETNDPEEIRDALQEMQQNLPERLRV